MLYYLSAGFFCKSKETYDSADPDRAEPNIADVVRLLEWLDPVRRPNVVLGPPPQP